MWVGRQYYLHQSLRTGQFVYCKEEQELRGAESDDHPEDLEEKATGSGITVDGYVKVQSLPYAYDQGAEAKPDDIESASVVWCLPPPLRVVSRSGGVGCGILHLFCGSDE